MLHLAKFATMSEQERSRALSELMSAPPNDARARAEIRALESRYEMASETMRQRVSAGELDTADTARWLVLLAALGR